jgi:hypothetical protein
MSQSLHGCGREEVAQPNHAVERKLFLHASETLQRQNKSEICTCSFWASLDMSVTILPVLAAFRASELSFSVFLKTAAIKVLRKINPSCSIAYTLCVSMKACTIGAMVRAPASLQASGTVSSAQHGDRTIRFKIRMHAGRNSLHGVRARFFVSVGFMCKGSSAAMQHLSHNTPCRSVCTDTTITQQL